MTLLFHLRISGAILTALGLAHIYFPKRFDWRREAAALSPLTRQILSVHNAYIGLTVGLNGLLALLFAEDLVHPSHLGLVVSTGIAVFWGSRFFVQLLVYSPSLWKGKRFETSVHVAFAMFWAYLAIVFGLTAWGQFQARSIPGQTETGSSGGNRATAAAPYKPAFGPNGVGTISTALNDGPSGAWSSATSSQGLSPTPPHSTIASGI